MARKRAEERIEPLELDSIRIDGGTQPRCEIDQSLVAEYAADIEAGVELPPAVVFIDGAEKWLADGFHRYAAYRRAGRTAMPCDVRVGLRRDAILWSVGANASHGKRRTNADKRKAVLTLLNDEEWGKWTDREIARQCKVSHNFVGDVRRSLSSDDSEKPAERTYTTKHGTTATMNTANIGKRAEPSQPIAEPGPPFDTTESAPTIDETPADAAAIDFPADVYPSEEEEAPPATEAMKDAAGREVPPNLTEVFALRSKFRGLIQTLGAVETTLRELLATPAGHYLDTRTIAEVKTIQNAVKYATPYVVCKHCNAIGCVRCYQTGFMGETSISRSEAKQ